MMMYHRDEKGLRLLIKKKYEMFRGIESVLVGILHHAEG